MSTDLIATRYLSKQLLRAVIDETATANLQRLPPPPNIFPILISYADLQFVHQDYFTVP